MIIRDKIMHARGIIEKVKKTGISYEEYLQRLTDKKPAEGDEHSPEIYKINLQRMNRLDKHYVPSEALADMMKKLDKRQFWMVISEDWCGDSAQNLPILAKIAALNGKTEFKIIFRDENPEIMDKYLSNGTRSIPKLIAFDESGKELFQWGARPKDAQALVDQLKRQGIEKEKFLEQLHLWYGRNRGKALEVELSELVSSQI